MLEIKEKLQKSINLLPEKDINLLYDIVQRMLITFDADYTYVTAEEDERIQQGLTELEASDHMSLDDFVKQNNIGG